MKKSVLLASLVAAVALAACGKKEEAAAPLPLPLPLCRSGRRCRFGRR